MSQALPASPRGRRRLAAVLAVLIVAAVVIVGYRRRDSGQDRPPPPARGPVLGPYALMVAPGIYYLGGLSPAVAYVVETSDGLVLIDSGLERDARQLRHEMSSLGLDVGRLRAIFLTHVHGDHSGGAEHLRELTGAKIYAGRGDAAVLRAGRPREAFFSTFEMPAEIQPVPTTVDVELQGGKVITVGDTRFEALDTPGHTPGSVCYLMERGEQRALFSGDVIWALSTLRQEDIPGARPLGTYAAYLSPRYRGNVEDFLATLRRLRSLPAPALVLPGHPHNDPEPQSPAMTQEHWEALLDPGIAEMEAVRARYKRDGAAFLDGRPKQLLPGLLYLGDFQGVAIYGLIAEKKLTLVNAPGGPGLDDFLAAGLKQLGVAPLQPSTVLLTSGDVEETSGLAGLVARRTCRVVASPQAWEAIKESLPPGAHFLTADELPDKGWLSVQTIPLGGRGIGPVAYLLTWGKKRVLFSGRIPVKLNRAAYEKLMWDIGKSRDNAPAYRRSLERLAQLKPDLWLPTFPTEGQNANLYGNDWQKVVGDNRQLFP